MVIKLDAISKQYKNHTALCDINITLQEGIYGLLGPNGAGKSTFIKLLSTNLRQTAGQIFCDGQNIHNMGKVYRKIIGYMPQKQELYPYFTGRQFLIYIAGMKGVPKDKLKTEITSVAEKTNMESLLDLRIGEYSGGMKQRLLIAQALIGDPLLLILDEPTAGLDPKERIRIRNLISENSVGKVVVVATHVVQDIECIANHIIILKNGRIEVHNTPEQLLSQIENYVWEMKMSLQEAENYKTDYKVSNIMRCKEGMKVRIVSQEKPREDAILVEPDLEDLYLYLFGNEEMDV